VLCLAAGVVLAAVRLLGTTFELMQYLRPPSVLEFTAGGHYSQGWGTCFANLGDLQSLLAEPFASTGDLRVRGAEDATALRALLAQALPLLMHTAATLETAHQQAAQSCISSPQSLQDQLHQSSTSQEGVVCQTVSDLPSPTVLSSSSPSLPSTAAPAGRGEAKADAQLPTSSVGFVPADSALLLLMGASGVVQRCVAVGLYSAAAYSIISGRAAVTGSQGQPSSSTSHPSAAVQALQATKARGRSQVVMT
jgi:hypothetical protein